MPTPAGIDGAATSGGGILNLIERIGNRLPDPATLFLIGTVLVILASWIISSMGVTVVEKLPQPVTETVTDASGAIVERPVLDESGAQVIEWVATGNEYTATSLLTRDGIFWMIESMVDNFVGFAPLGVVLVGMLGIGICERTGFIGAILKTLMLVVPGHLLTPTMVFLGIMSSMTLDAGYVVLPPLAAALYKAVGRSPLAGLAAVFAGVAAGFNANLFITGLDPMLAGFANIGARVIEPDYLVNPACNLWFMMASTVVMTLTGWAVTSFFVERRLHAKAPEDGGPVLATAEDLAAHRLTPEESSSMVRSLGVMVGVLAVILALILIPGAPLYTYEEEPGFDRWVTAIVPLLFFIFIIPGIAYGIFMGKLKSDKDVARLLIESMAGMAPIIVLAFFAAQFIEYFGHSGLDRMLALSGGLALGQANMPPWLLIVLFIGVTMVFNLFIGSMSAKYAMFAPIFIPMFMMVGISPELTQAAYRIGDSVTNIITPLNPYLIIILVFMQKFVPRGGMGTLVSTMLPYTIVFAVVWTIMIVIWMALGIPLGPGGGLTFTPGG
ncbi:MAG: AbgT family transporter [Planctomycetota bacterium]|jgi:aminobenzoyl-glutamate transport protein